MITEEIKEAVESTDVLSTDEQAQQDTIKQRLKRSRGWSSTILWFTTKYPLVNGDKMPLAGWLIAHAVYTNDSSCLLSVLEKVYNSAGLGEILASLVHHGVLHKYEGKLIQFVELNTKAQFDREYTKQLSLLD